MSQLFRHPTLVSKFASSPICTPFDFDDDDENFFVCVHHSKILAFINAYNVCNSVCSFLFVFTFRLSDVRLDVVEFVRLCEWRGTETEERAEASGVRRNRLPDGAQ